MSASERKIFRPISQSNANVTTQSLLNFDQIFELLNKGLVDFIACFSENEERATEFKASFASSLIMQPLDKHNFNQFGTLMIKAAYPGILRLSVDEHDKLKKLGILSLSQGANESINYFFKRDHIDAFLKTEIKEKYKQDIGDLIDTIYRFIETACASIEYESILTRYDKQNKIIIDKNTQPSIYSGIDLQLANATNNLKLISTRLIKLKGKTSKADAITQSLEKIRAAITTANSERSNNLSEQKSANLKNETNATKSELDIPKVTLQSIQAELEDEKRKALDLAAQKEQLETLAFESLDPAIMVRLKIKTSNFSTHGQVSRHSTSLSSKSSPSSSSSSSMPAAMRQTSEPNEFSKSSRHSSDLSSSSIDSFSLLDPYSLTERYKVEIARKESERMREQENLKMSTDMIVEEAKTTSMSAKNLTEIFANFLKILHSPNSTQVSILRNLIQWEKSALAYIENHTSTANMSTTVAQHLPNSLVSALSFIGQKTGIGKMKTVDPALATALKNQLADILKQCIVITELDKNFIDCVKALNQHQRYLKMNHSEAVLVQGTVSAQFEIVTLGMTEIATKRFDYKTTTPGLR